MRVFFNFSFPFQVSERPGLLFLLLGRSEFHVAPNDLTLAME